ncbi:DUF6973 domain-containing protein [Dyadobacter psychrophilus]|uniref:DUF6973 domain-containing protein n=1 Tax=Dyadobacter psychrophilus TaxID=651661 RepID=A0A1T5C9V7_9BACT|nr:hypothetical protein [Dyadobacter psychrophilus]SKB55900.1 hypothetical protein SAMN05660293_01011 [Dyadobacter psychrophilus]
MHLILRKGAFLAVFGAILLACDTPYWELTPNEDASETLDTIQFKGERVVIPGNFPKELFHQTQEEFDVYYESISGKGNARTSGEVVLITYEELLPILVKHNAKYPLITSEEGILEKDLERVFRDFPDITTHEEANEKRALIYDFYQALCKRDVVAEVVALEGVKRENGRILGPESGGLTTPEKNHLLLNPGYAQWYVQAAQDAINLATTLFGNAVVGNKGNAFKHSTWNALSIRFILKGSPASENQAIDFTQDGCSKHEQNDNGLQIHDKDSAMDLHNNMSAREWMENETSWGFGPFRKMPSVDEIINNMHSKANSCAMHNMVDILNWHGGDNSVTWNNLFNNLYSPNQHLVHVMP